MPRKSSAFCRPYVQVRRHDNTTPANAAPWTLPALCAAYNWPSGLPGGGVIALIELGGGWLQADMNAFFPSIGQPVPQLTDISLDGVTNKPNQHAPGPDDPDSEVAMDIQVAATSYFATIGKPAVIRIYWTDDIATGVRHATTDGCDVCAPYPGVRMKAPGALATRTTWKQHL
jgi:kumamolisin